MFSSSTRLFSFQFSSMDGLDAMLENGPWFIRNNPLILKKCYPDENLLKEDVSSVLVWVKLHGVPVTAFSEDGLSAIATKLGVPVGQKIGFKPQKEYIHVPKKTIAGSSGNKNKGVVPTIEVKNSNLFEVLNSIDNDVDTETTPIIDKIREFEKLLTRGKTTLVDESDNPLKKVEYPDDYDSEDKVASVDNDMARFMDSERVGFGTQSLLEQWRDSYGNCDYDE
ncbi:retrovirus-related pol polyprotein from transposon TNT 1-94, partial [Tanacetum coccineum]